LSLAVAAAAMCEQVFQQNPTYFRKFSKLFRYVVTEKYPDLSGDIAFAFHNTKSSACTNIGGNNQHWHVLTYSEKNLPKNGYAVPCPYACFVQLILGGVNVQYSGDIFDKLKTAVTYNEKYDTEESRDHILKKHLPKILKTVKSQQQHSHTQTDMICSASLERYLRVLNGPYGGDLSQIIDAFISGYGSVHIQQHSMVTNFELTCSNAQCYCYECTEVIDIDDD